MNFCILCNMIFNWNVIEFIAVVFSIIYVLLAAKKNIWCWFFAAFSVLIYTYLCFNAQLYMETILQCFYLIMAFYGYYNWSKNSSKSYKIKIIELPINKHLQIIFLGAVVSFLMGYFLANYSDAKMALLDSFTTTFSIIATFMVAKKILDNWLYWIAIDISSIYLYNSRDLHLTAILFFIYTIIAIYGYKNWLQKLDYQ